MCPPIPLPPQVVSKQLMQAMVAACRPRPDRSEMVSYFTSSQHPPLHIEFVGIAKFVLNLKVGCDKQLSVALDALRLKCQGPLTQFWGFFGRGREHALSGLACQR